jgi:hypothetical protein
MYRDPAFHAWEPKKGTWKRHVCDFIGHEERMLHKKRYHLEAPEFPDDPKPLVPALPQTLVVHWISAVDLCILSCDRCGEEWEEQVSVRSIAPIETTRWLVLR